MKAFVTAIVVTLIMAVLHEGGHALAAKALGYDVVASLNSVTTPHGDPTGSEQIIISIAGPLVTFIGALIGLSLAASGLQLGVTIAGTAFLYRMMAAIVSMQNPNDEMRVSLDLGMGQWTLPGLVCGLLLLMTAYAAVKARTGPLFLILTWLGFSLAITGIVFGEGYLPTLQF